MNYQIKKKLTKTACAMWPVIASKAAFADNWKINEVPATNFLKDTKITEFVNYAHWMLLIGAGAICACLLIVAGNKANQGHYAAAFGSIFGAVLAGSALYIVPLIMK